MPMKFTSTTPWASLGSGSVLLRIGSWQRRRVDAWAAINIPVNEGVPGKSLCCDGFQNQSQRVRGRHLEGKGEARLFRCKTTD